LRSAICFSAWPGLALAELNIRCLRDAVAASADDVNTPPPSRIKIVLGVIDLPLLVGEGAVVDSLASRS
jgi:hypothetical protein